ncbi:MAG: cytochrome P450 [Zavarzinella sp.]|nr:cytochrome P450 [Zavarzinella sp.]
MNGKYPPGPRDGLFGITLHGPMRRDPLGFAVRVAREYGDFAFVRLGWVRLYFVHRPELIRDVLVAKARSFRKVTRQMRALRKIEGDGLVVAEGPTWARHRPVVQGSFHPRHFARYADAVVACTRRRLDRWRPGEPFDIATEMNELALEIIARLVFNEDVADWAAALRDAVHAFRQAMQGEGGSPVVLPDWLPLPSKVRERRALRIVDHLIWKLIRDRQASGTGGDDMLGQILAAVADRPGLGITAREIRDEIATLFVAGHDTTSAALAWLWFALSQHPEAERRVLQEVDLLGTRPVRHADLPRLKYVEMVVKESMRLYPATAFLFGREALEDVELGGYTLRRGSWVFISPYVVQRDARNFPDPEVFDPERFAPGRADQIPPYSYLVFGAGPRTCIGNALATTELVLVAATVLQRYRLALDQPPPEAEMEVVLRPKGGLRMRAEVRSGHDRLAVPA